MTETITEETPPRIGTLVNYVENYAPVPRKEPNTMKLSINVAHEIGHRLRRLAFDRRVSESSIVEVALQALYADRDDHALAHVLREGGASLRRKRGDSTRVAA
jgi:predicted transcriptional regulator